MDTLAKVDTILFDKTGTLTKGKPEVTDFKLFVNEDENELFRQVAEAEMISEHHLGKTIVNEAKTRGLKMTGNVSNGKVIKGNGICATVENRTFVIGNRKLMIKENIQIEEIIENYAVKREKKGNTAIFVAADGQIVAVLSIADEIREDASRALH